MLENGHIIAGVILLLLMFGSAILGPIDSSKKK